MCTANLSGGIPPSYGTFASPWHRYGADDRRTRSGAALIVAAALWCCRLLPCGRLGIHRLVPPVRGCVQCVVTTAAGCSIVVVLSIFVLKVDLVKYEQDGTLPNVSTGYITATASRTVLSRLCKLAAADARYLRVLDRGRHVGRVDLFLCRVWAV